jgi:hypothetical protein
MSEAPRPDERTTHVEAYKTILRDILDQRPSGTRQRLATALGKNRSFVSQMCNPAHPVAIPAPHLEIIFEICHFPPSEKRAFLEAFGRAHPQRIRLARASPALRSLRLEVVDFGDEKKNRAFDDLVRDTTKRIARLIGRPGE